MKIKRILFFLILSLICLNNISYSREAVKIIVKIDDELITNYDIKNKIISSLLISNESINQKNINNLKERSLEFLIRNRLKKIELKKHNFKKDFARINSYLSAISSNDIKGLENRFQIHGLNFQEYVNELDLEFKWRTLIFQKFSKKIDIKPEEIEEEVKSLINQNNQEEYNLSEIEIESIDEKIDEIKIIEIKNLIYNEGFKNAVKKFSISDTSSKNGNLGWVNSNSLSKEFQEILKKMKVNEISKPIKKENKIIFFKLEDKRVSNYSEKDIDILRKKLLDQKKQDLFKLYSNSYISKLKNTYLIEYLK